MRLLLLFLLMVLLTACAPAEVEPPPGPIVGVVASPTAEPATVAAATPPASEAGAAGDQLQPYPFTTPLPPPAPTELDGVYLKKVNFTGTPTPCRRCAPYRGEGGTWTMILDKGVFRVSHDGTDFTGVGSFTVADGQLTLFNDPNCHLDIGTYSWEMDGRSLRLTPIGDTCAFDLRAKNLGAGSWIKQTDEQGNLLDSCQPPNHEAAITGHWPAPEGCHLAGQVSKSEDK